MAMTAHAKQRLTRERWIAAGLDVLADRGPEALKAEPLARHLGTTKGSFYWHFRDVPAFHAELLSAWEGSALAALALAMSQESNSVGQLRHLCQTIADPVRSGSTGRVEQAVRSWASGHEGAKAAVGRVDAARLSQLQQLLSDTGIGNPEMARILYAAATGMLHLDQNDRDENRRTIGSLVDLVLALR